MEIFFQLGCGIAFSVVNDQGGLSPAMKRKVKEFVESSLSIGHYLSLWKELQNELRISSLANDFRAYSDLLGGKHQKIIDDYPRLRNEIKGHDYFRANEELGKKFVTEHLGSFLEILQDYRWLIEDFVFFTPTDSIDDIWQITLLQGVTNFDMQDEACPKVAPEIGFETGVLYVTTRAAINGDYLSTKEVVRLDPFFVLEADHIYFYQGKKGGTATYVSVSTEERFSAPWGKFQHQISQLLPIQIKSSQKAKKGPKPLPVEEHLKNIEVVSESKYIDEYGNVLAGKAAGFFKGNTASWADINENLDVPRNVYSSAGKQISPEQFLDEYIPDIKERALEGSIPVVVFSGHGGSGKTTHLLRLAFDLHRKEDIMVLKQRPGTDIDIQDLKLVHEHYPKKAIFLFVDEAEYYLEQIRLLVKELPHKQLPVAIFCAERPNLWRKGLETEQFSLRTLTRTEAESLLTRLEDNDLLGVLKEASQEERLQHLENVNENRLLVTLREATSGERFDKIILDEYDKIPKEEAKEFYLFVAISHRAGGGIPVRFAQTLTGVGSKKEFHQNILKPCEELIYRHGGEYRARHAVIAEQLCKSILVDEETEIIHVGALIKELLLREQYNNLRDSKIELVIKLLTYPATLAALSETDVDEIIQAIRSLRSLVSLFFRELYFQAENRPAVALLQLQCFAENGMYQNFFVSDRILTTNGGLVAEAYGIDILYELARNILRKSSVGGNDFVPFVIRKMMNEDKRDQALEFTLEAIQLFEERGEKSLLSIYFCLIDIYQENDDLKAAIKTTEEAIKVIKALDGSGLSHLYSRLSDIYRKLEDLDTAMEMTIEGIQVVKSADRKGLEHLYFRLIELHRRRDDLDAAIAAAKEGISLSRGLEESGLHLLYSHLIDLYTQKGELGAAIDAAKEGIEVNKKSGYPEFALYFRLVDLYCKNDDLDAAIDAAKEGIERTRIADGKGLRSLYTRLVDIYIWKEELDTAIQTAEEGIDIIHNFDGRGLEQLYFRLIDTYRKKNEQEKAISVAKEGIEIARKVDGKGLEPLYFRLIETYFEMGALALGIETAEEGIEAVKAFGGNGLFQLYACLTDAYLKKEDLEKALETAKEGIETVEKLGGKGLNHLYIRLVDLHQKKDDEQTTITLAREGIEVIKGFDGKGLDHLYFRLADIYRKNDDLESMISICLEGIETLKKFERKGFVGLYFILGKCYLQTGQIELAIQSLEEGRSAAVQTHVRHKNLYKELILIYWNDLRFERIQLLNQEIQNLVGEKEILHEDLFFWLCAQYQMYFGEKDEGRAVELLTAWDEAELRVKLNHYVIACHQGQGAEVLEKFRLYLVEKEAGEELVYADDILQVCQGFLALQKGREGRVSPNGLRSQQQKTDELLSAIAQLSADENSEGLGALKYAIELWEHEIFFFKKVFLQDGADAEMDG